MSVTLVFLCSYNGEQFLVDQLASIFAQTVPVRVIVSDDGSTDRTIEIIEDFAAKGFPIEIVSGPRQGSGLNFLSIFGRAELLNHDFLAFSDQDDVWHPNHLERAIAMIGAHQDPALYGSRTRWISEVGEFIRISPRRTKPMSFENAMLQCFAGGNTFVLNRGALQWLGQRMPALDVPRQVSHDWLIYQIMTAAGHQVAFDPEPSINYRQHSRNILGENRSLNARFARLQLLLSGRYRRQVDAHYDVLTQLSSSFPKSNLERFGLANRLRKQWFPIRTVLWPKLKFRRDRKIETFIFYLLVVLRLY